MVGIYLSGTGNTKHCIERLLHLIDETAEAVPIESDKAAELLSRHDLIVLGYPVQFSNIPFMVRDFIKINSKLWKDKKVFCVATMVLFSGDGAGCASRLLKKYGAIIVGGMHLKMPDSICDVKLLKKSAEKNCRIIKAADRKIEKCAEKISCGKYPKDGLYLYNRVEGLICQRLWFYRKTKGYSDKLKIGGSCIGCGLCANLCPMKNIKLNSGKAAAGSRCTMCYRCVSSCPMQAITLLGDTVIEQCRFDKYVNRESTMD